MAGALSCCLAFFRWFPVIFIVSVIAWSYYAYVINLCFLLDPPISVAEKVIYIILYHPLFIMFMWAYWKTIFTEPATVPDQFYLDENEYAMYKEEEEEHRKRDILAKVVRDKNIPVNCRTHHNGMRICEKCHCIKPDRAHHCSVCGTCILKMDHHCPWVNNCVCYNTYKFFVLFLAYGLIYCLFIVITVAQYFVKFWTEPGKGNFHVLFLFFAAAMFAISLTSLFGYHCYLTVRNKSTLESFRPPIFRTGPEKDGYNLGSYTNFIQIFGERKLYWFLPVFSSLGDGATYPTRTPAALNASYGTNDSPSESDTIFSSKVNLYEAHP